MTDESQVQKLVKKAAGGSSESFGQLYDLYSARIFNFILARVRHKPTAEDLLNTIFLKAWKNLPKYRQTPNAKFSTWLFQIANFTIIDYWRTNKETSTLDALENLAEFAHNPRLYENYKFLWQALDELSEDYRAVLNLRFIQDLSIEETAEALRKSHVGVRVIQHRALKALRKIMISRGYDNF